jgi:hypothetical protein
MRRSSRRRLALVGAAVLLLAASACDPIENAPPGGGEVIVEDFRLGPFNLAPQGQPGSQDQGAQSNVPRPPGGFGMKSIEFDLVDASGNPIPRHEAHLHHVVLMNPARRSMYCDNWPERFAASGSERTPTALPDPYAYMVSSSEQWNALWHVMNMSSSPQEVYIQWKVGYQPGATSENTRGVTPFFLDVTGCGNSEYDVPGDGGPDSLHSMTRTWTMPWDGYHVGSGGHVHGGGVDITISNDTTGEICRMFPTYEDGQPHGAPSEMSTCPLHKRFEGGQQLSVTSRYDNSQPYQDVMGIVLAYAWQGTQ